MAKDREKIDKFLAEIIEVCKGHELSLGHEDIHGNFQVCPFTDYHSEWLLQAEDCTEK